MLSFEDFTQRYFTSYFGLKTYYVKYDMSFVDKYGMTHYIRLDDKKDFYEFDIKILYELFIKN